MSGRHSLEEAEFRLRGEVDDDEAGSSMAVWEFDENGTPDPAIGAPRNDGDDIETGTVYLLSTDF